MKYKKNFILYDTHSKINFNFLSLKIDFFRCCISNMVGIYSLFDKELKRELKVTKNP
jgi:hypothetical protein